MHNPIAIAVIAGVVIIAAVVIGASGWQAKRQTRRLQAERERQGR